MLWKFDRNTAKLYRRRAKRDKNDSLIPHNSFFIRDNGRIHGARIDFVERYQAAQAMSKKI